MNKTHLIDLHTHSTASDGTDFPAALIQKAAALGISALALTDHDTIAGLPEARLAAGKHNIEFIPGCEISSETREGRFHILGLWVPEDSPPLHTFLATLRHARHQRNEKIIAKLQALGVDISMKELEEIADATPGRPHIATLLKQKGIVANLEEAFEKWLGKGGCAYMPKEVATSEEAVEFLSSIGAMPVLAHPLLNPISHDDLSALLGRLKERGLMALETWHSAQNTHQSRLLIELAKKYDLGLSGGSDYHGLAKPAISLGIGKNNLAISPDILTALKARRIQ